MISSIVPSLTYHFSPQFDPSKSLLRRDAEKASKYLFDRLVSLKSLGWQDFVNALFEEPWILSEDGEPFRMNKKGKIPRPDNVDGFVCEGDGVPTYLRALLLKDKKVSCLAIGVLQTEPGALYPSKRFFFSLNIDSAHPEQSLQVAEFLSNEKGGYFIWNTNAPMSRKHSFRDLQRHVEYAYYYAMYGGFPLQDTKVNFDPPTRIFSPFCISSVVVEGCQKVFETSMYNYLFKVSDKSGNLPIYCKPKDLREPASFVSNLPTDLGTEELKDYMNTWVEDEEGFVYGDLILGVRNQGTCECHLEIIPFEGTDPLLEGCCLGGSYSNFYQAKDGKLEMKIPVTMDGRWNKVALFVGWKKMKSCSVISSRWFNNFMKQITQVIRPNASFLNSGMLILVKPVLLEHFAGKSVEQQIEDHIKRMRLEGV